jgi:hypothetical protein
VAKEVEDVLPYFDKLAQQHVELTELTHFWDRLLKVNGHYCYRHEKMNLFFLPQLTDFVDGTQL